jgi:hypothetical protein
MYVSVTACGVRARSSGQFLVFKSQFAEIKSKGNESWTEDLFIEKKKKNSIEEKDCSRNHEFQSSLT